MFSLKIFSVATKRMKVFYELVNVFKTSYLEYIVINLMNIYTDKHLIITKSITG